MPPNNLRPLANQRCAVCDGTTHVLRDFGQQPLTNRFPRTADEADCVHALVLGQCHTCGLVQLTTPPPPEVLRPLEPMSYNEPEQHLDQMVDQVLALPGITKTSRFLGLTYKEATTLERLRSLGYGDTRLLSARDDLGIDREFAGLETIQSIVQPPLMGQLAKRHGKCDVLIVRHILEHAHDIPIFVDALTRLVVPDGHIVFEVPDCTAAMETFDYSVIWEEHVAYFTPNSLLNSLGHLGLNVRQLLVYPYGLENSLVAISGVERIESDRARAPDAEGERRSAASYAEHFELVKTQWQETLSKSRQSVGSTAILGAGHLAITFMNLLDVADLVDYVVDDAPDKVDRYLPGSRHQIMPTAALTELGVKFCLMAVAPESETKVISRNQSFIRAGGRFSSIFPNSKYAIKHHCSE